MFQETKAAKGARCLIVRVNSGWTWGKGGQTPGGRSSELFELFVRRAGPVKREMRDAGGL